MNIPSAATDQIRDAIVAARIITAVHRAALTGLAVIMNRAIAIGTAIAIESRATGRPNVRASRLLSRGAKSPRQVRFRLCLYLKAPMRPWIRLNVSSHVADAAADAGAGVAGAVALATWACRTGATRPAAAGFLGRTRVRSSRRQEATAGGLRRRCPSRARRSRTSSPRYRLRCLAPHRARGPSSSGRPAQLTRLLGRIAVRTSKFDL